MPGNKAKTENSPAATLAIMEKVANWQLVHPSPSIGRYKENSWTYGALYAGVMALDDVADTLAGSTLAAGFAVMRFTTNDRTCELERELFLADAFGTGK